MIEHFPPAAEGLPKAQPPPSSIIHDFVPRAMRLVEKPKAHVIVGLLLLLLLGSLWCSLSSGVATSGSGTTSSGSSTT
jgi:hypothetical protein